MKSRRCYHNDLSREHTLTCRGSEPNPTPTPTPWTQDANLIVADNATVAHCADWRNGKTGAVANAAFIVRAVNSHEELVVALKLALGMRDWSRGERANFESVLAKAEGK